MPRGADRSRTARATSPVRAAWARRAVPSALAALLAFGVAGCHHGGGTSGDAAPALQVHDLAGKPISLKALRGKVVLLDFWATWCEPCQEEMPRLAALQKQAGPKGLQIVGLSMDDQASTVRAFLADHPLPYPVAMATPALAERYGKILGLPTLIVIDRKGHLVKRHVGTLPAAQLNAEVDALLAR